MELLIAEAVDFEMVYEDKVFEIKKDPIFQLLYIRTKNASFHDLYFRFAFDILTDLIATKKYTKLILDFSSLNVIEPHSAQWLCDVWKKENNVKYNFTSYRYCINPAPKVLHLVKALVDNAGLVPYLDIKFCDSFPEAVEA